MLEDPSAGRQGGQRTAPQRSNRVFILEYSPERSKSKKQKQIEPVEQRKEKLSSFLMRRDMLAEESPAEELSHRRNIDRLTSLISRARSSREGGEGQSGCEKLVRAVEKIIKIKNPLKEAVEALKKYSMLCSSNNYQLFIQSKHYLLKDKRSNEALSPPPLSPLASINERQSFDEGRNSFDASQFSPKKDTLNSDVTFRKKPQEPRSPLQESILHGLDSPLKYFSPLKAGKESFPTAETLRSAVHLSSIMPTQSIPLPRFRNSKPCLLQMNEPALTFKGKKEEQFMHLYHLSSDRCTINEILPSESVDQIEKMLLSVSSDIKSSPKTSIFKKSKLDFALPTPAPANINTKINIKYVSQAVPLDLQKGNESFKKRRNQVLLSAKQIADRMLFGMEVPAAPEKQLAVEKPQVVEARGRKRVSSLPRITFTYSSRDKDWKEQTPSAKCIPQSPKAQPLKAVLQAGSPRKKEELHSTFGSTQMAVDSSNSRSSRMKSPMQVQSVTRVVRREPSAHNPFASRPIAPAAQAQAPRIDSQYYGSFAQKHPIVPQQQLRPRMVTQQVLASSNQIEYVGIEQQPRGCCWAKERSRSLNERVLVGVQRPPF